MTAQYAELKQQHRDVRDSYPENLNLRVHRALSWLHRAELCDDVDGKFVFLWIAFNAAYNNDYVDQQVSERSQHEQFLWKLVKLDKHKVLSKLVWQQFSIAIRLLLRNRYVFQGFWDHINGQISEAEWRERFSKAKQAANLALARDNTADVLAIVLSRLYTLRNQLMHGGATFNSKVNRQQMQDATRLMERLVPAVIQIMLASPNEHWGEASYQVVE
ncbi:HEPN domain-containing protein [Salinibius halmophilus]|uniref:HEPN domain-containing protein n=1 Tax=Salinibius halmophilus TaxID=1853216 RepID=UPI000E672FAB|nr:HEPN domain-containing protein [Salinibius halmophilus]